MHSAAAFKRRAAAAFILLFSMLATACVIDTPAIDDGTAIESGAGSTVAEAEPTATPASPPTPQPTPVPEPTPEPTTAPDPTPEPTPTVEPTPESLGPVPLPTVTEDSDFVPTVIEPGLVAIPVANASFQLNEARPILQLGGHTLIYLDADAQAEVDIFTPVAFDDQSLIGSYDELITFLETDPLFSLDERNEVTIAGIATRVFEGEGNERFRAFITDETVIDNEIFGWVPPDRLRLWVIDHPDGPLIVSAEALNDSGQYSAAIRLASDILSTIDFG